MPKASLDICKSSLVASHRTTLSQLSKPANKTLPYPTYTGRIEEYSLEAKGELNGQILFRQLEVVEPRAPLAMIQPLILLFNIHISGSEPCPALLGQMSAGLVCHAWRAALLEAVPSAHPAPWSVSCVRQRGGCLGVKSTAMLKVVFLCPIPVLLLTSWVTRQMSFLASEPHFLTCKIDIKQQKPFERIHLENAYGGLPVCIFPPLLGSDLPAVMRRRCDFGGPEEARRVALKSFPRE